MIAANCEHSLDTINMGLLCLVLIGLAWAMTAWVRMIRAMKSARIEYELATMQANKPHNPAPDDGL